MRPHRTASARLLAAGRRHLLAPGRDTLCSRRLVDRGEAVSSRRTASLPSLGFRAGRACATAAGADGDDGEEEEEVKSKKSALNHNWNDSPRFGATRLYVTERREAEIRWRRTGGEEEAEAHRYVEPFDGCLSALFEPLFRCQ